MKNLSKFLRSGGLFEGKRMVKSGQDLYRALEADSKNTLGQFVDFPFREDETRKFFSIATSNAREFDSISLRGDIDDFSYSNTVSILSNIDSNSFHSGFFADADYLDLQKQVHRNQYKYTGGLKEDKSWGDKNRVLVKGRPGRGAGIPNKGGLLETGAAHFWFGDLIYKDIPRDRILSFDQAHEIKELPNGIIYVNLYEGTFNGNLPENQAKQEAFKEHLGLIQDF